MIIVLGLSWEKINPNNEQIVMYLGWFDFEVKELN